MRTPSAARFREQRYLPARRMLPRAFLGFLHAYYDVLLANGRFHRDDQCPSSLSLGGDPALDAVLEWMKPRVSGLVGFDLMPTYSYTRVYARGETLERHTDREACEISVTLAVRIPENAGPATLYLRPPGGREAKVTMREGDGCVYAGTEVEHWREPFAVGGYVQLFLHFIDRRGKRFPKHVFDQRAHLGAPRRTKNPRHRKGGVQ